MNPDELWPLSALRVRGDDLELRYLDDELIFELARVAARGVHPADEMPFQFPWTRGTETEVARSLLRYQWRARAGISPERWTIELGVLCRGKPVGIQAITASSFATTRSAETGSWLGQEFQGQGVGTAMRELVLHFAFTGLGALEMTTSAWADNARSNRVSAKVGYAPNGVSTQLRDGERAQMRNYVLTRDAWRAGAEARGREVRIDGIDGVRELLGLD